MTAKVQTISSRYAGELQHQQNQEEKARLQALLAAGEEELSRLRARIATAMAGTQAAKEELVIAVNERQRAFESQAALIREIASRNANTFFDLTYDTAYKKAAAVIDARNSFKKHWIEGNTA